MGVIFGVGDVTVCGGSAGRAQPCLFHFLQVCMIVAPKITILALTPSWLFPLYHSLQQRRPLPLVSERQEDSEEEEDTGDHRGAHPELEFSSGDEDIEQEEEETFLPDRATDAQPARRTSHSKSGSGSSRRRKKKSLRRDSSASDDSDQEANRRPLAASIHHNRQKQRVLKHPIQHPMAGRKGGRSSTRLANGKSNGGHASQSDAVDEANQQRDHAEKENAELKLQLAAIQQRLKLERTGQGKKLKSTTQQAMSREVAKCTKQQLWKVCKFIKSENKLVKATRFVMLKLDLVEMEGLQGPELAEAQEIWIATYKDDVRRALNQQRNYCQQELRSVMEQAFKDGKAGEFPNVGEMEALILRDNLDDQTPEGARKEFEVKFDNMWNVLIPKVSGHHAWGPNKRHYGLLSFCSYVAEDEKEVPYVSPSDEAFLVTIWKNCYEKWYYKEQCRRDPEKEVDPKDKNMETPFTDPKGGQKRFGGWLKAGYDYYEEARGNIAKNRIDQKEYLQQVEQLALERIRKAENVDPEADKKKKATKRKAEEMEDDDETEDENDFDNWD